MKKSTVTKKNILIRDCKSTRTLLMEVDESLLNDLILIDKDFYKHDQKQEDVRKAYINVIEHIKSITPKISPDHIFDGYFGI